ncbi:hypothetical protein JTB14_037276 [Gonioctena quinquepunctata]|nr:hypothetical protein JTB14_037276 [Gonioctena quinquepunctata]
MRSCVDMIVGHDLLKEHSDVNITFDGPRCFLTVCHLALANLDIVPLFSNLFAKCEPIAVRSRRYSPEDLKFSKEEIQRLLKESIMNQVTHLGVIKFLLPPTIPIRSE